MNPHIANFLEITASGIVVWLLADIARSNRRIWREFREHRDRLTIIETRCAEHHKVKR